MARSLTVKHEEKPTAFSLLTAFLILAFGWLALVAVLAAAGDDQPPPPTQFEGQ